MIQIKEIREAEGELKTINEAQDEFDKNSQEERRELNEKYYKLEEELSNKKLEEHSKIDKFRGEINEKYEANKENSIQILREHKEIINILKINQETRYYSIREPLVYRMDYIYSPTGFITSRDKVKKFYQILKVLVDDDFKKIYLYITQNGKPKNKFSLISVGNTKLNSKMLEIPYSYGIEVSVDKANIISLVKDFETEDKAKEYLKRNKKRILKDFLEKHTEQEEYFKSVVEELEDSKEWKIEILETDKRYYERCVSNGTEEPKYKEICKRLEELKNE